VRARHVSPRRRALALAASALAATTAAAVALAAPRQAEPAPNPCQGPQAAELLCPDLLMAPPRDLEIDRRAVRGRVVLRATNSIDSRGAGPAELRGRRDGERTMGARQVIHRVDGSRLYVRTGARLYFQPIPDQGRYWKFADAARFELWRLDAERRRVELVRVGPKQNYCLRDLERTARMRRSPRRRVYPACSQNRRQRAVTLGTSVGWSDVYPATYHQNWIDVTGLRGTFAFVHIADPRNGIHESDETNNSAETIVSLPSGRALDPPEDEHGSDEYPGGY
jgi:hypothetical protein